MLKADASCATGIFDPEMWFPTRASETARNVPASSDAGRARLVCAECPARAECLVLAMTAEAGTPETLRWGIFGGLGPGERARLARTGSGRGSRVAGPESWFNKPGALSVVRGWRDGELSTERAAAEVKVTRVTWLHGIGRVTSQILRTGEALPAYEGVDDVGIRRSA